jgi:hypothetical protein
MCAESNIRTQELTQDWRQHNYKTNNLYGLTLYEDEQIYENETGGACSRHGKRQGIRISDQKALVYKELFKWTVKGVDWIYRYKCRDLKKMGLMWTGFICIRIGSSRRLFEHGNESSGSKQRRSFL